MPVDVERNLASCCMCFSIKTGCKIIGHLSLFYSAIHFMFYTMTYIQRELNFPNCYKIERGNPTDNQQMEHTCYTTNMALVRVALLLGCLLYLFGLIGSAMLLKGIEKKLPKLFYAWFLYCTVIIVRNLMSYGTFHNVNEGMKNLLFCLVLVYFFCIIKYHERELLCSADDIYGVNTAGNTALQDVVTTYPVQAGLPKDNPPPYSMVVDIPPPPYSACATYHFEGQPITQLAPVAAATSEVSRTEDANVMEQRAEVETVQNATVAEQRPTGTDNITNSERSPNSSHNSPPTSEQSPVARISSQHSVEEQNQNIRRGNSL